MGSSSVVEGLVLSRDRSQVAVTEDQHPVGDLRLGGEREPFGAGVRAGTAGRDHTASTPAGEPFPGQQPGERAGSRLARTLSVAIRGFTHPGPASARTYDGQDWARRPVPAIKPQVRRHMTASGQAVCKTVGLAYDGSNPSPATTSENGPRPGVSPASQTVVRCVILCHGRSGDVAAPRWLRTYSGRIRGWRSGSPNRLLRTLPGV